MAVTRKSTEPTKRASRVKPADPAVMAKLKRDLITVFRRWNRIDDARAEATAERDRVICDAHAAGFTPSEISELADQYAKGLAPQRVTQIRQAAQGRLT